MTWDLISGNTQQNEPESDSMCKSRDWELDLELSARCWALSVQCCAHCALLCLRKGEWVASPGLKLCAWTYLSEPIFGLLWSEFIPGTAEGRKRVQTHFPQLAQALLSGLSAFTVPYILILILIIFNHNNLASWYEQLIRAGKCTGLHKVDRGSLGSNCSWWKVPKLLKVCLNIKIEMAALFPGWLQFEH